MNVLCLSQTVSAASPQGLAAIDNRITFKSAERDFQGFPQVGEKRRDSFWHRCVLEREIIFLGWQNIICVFCFLSKQSWKEFSSRALTSVSVLANHQSLSPLTPYLSSTRFPWKPPSNVWSVFTVLIVYSVYTNTFPSSGQWVFQLAGKNEPLESLQNGN